MVLTERHFRAVELLFIATVAYELALLADVHVEGALMPPLSVSTASPLQARAQARSWLDPIALADLFHLPSPLRSDPPAGGMAGIEPGDDSIQASTLHAELRATTVGRPVELSWAIIRDLTAQRTGVFLLGDAVFDGTLITVGEGYVLIARHAHVERLEMGAVPILGAARSDAEPATSAAMVERNGNIVSIHQADLQHLLANPSEVINDLRLRPHFEGASLKGFQVDWLKQGSLLASTGLQAGDVIQRVNGIALDSAESALGILAQARTAPRVEVELLRGGQPATYAIEVR